MIAATHPVISEKFTFAIATINAIIAITIKRVSIQYSFLCVII